MRVVVAACMTCLCLASFLFASNSKADAIKDCNSKDWDRRIKGCTAALKSERFDKKNKALVYSLRGEAYIERQKSELALADFDKCVELNPKDNFCWSSKALVHSDMGQVDEAIRAYVVIADLLDKSPKTDVAKTQMVLMTVHVCETLENRAKERFGKAVGSMAKMALPPEADRKGVEDAISDLTGCLRFAPDDPEILGTRALYSYLLGRRDQAIADAQTARKEAPENVEALAVLAMTALDGKDYTRSVEFSQQWHKLAPGNAHAEEQLGKALKAVGRKEEADALAALSENRANCTSVTTAINGGEQANVDDGIAACGKVIEAPGIDVSTLIAPYEFRGFLRGVKGDHEGSVADYTRAIEISGGAGKFATFYTERGRKLVALKQHERAIADFDAALTQLPDNVTALSLRGLSLEQLGKKDQAIADFRKALSIDPALAECVDGLKRLGATP